MISSTETSGALSMSLKPSSTTSKTAKFVTIRFTQATPVKGSVHFFKSFDSPFRLVWVVATIMFFAEALGFQTK